MDLGASGVAFKFKVRVSPGEGQAPYFPTQTHEFTTPTLKYGVILTNLEKAGRDIKAEGHRFVDKWRRFWRKKSGDRGDGGKAGDSPADGPSGSDDAP